MVEEAERARELFPNPNLLLTAFSEEAGEVVQAVLDNYHGKDSGPGGMAIDNIRKEIIQAGAMLIRLATEGDPVHRMPAIVGEGNDPGLIR